MPAERGNLRSDADAEIATLGLSSAEAAQRLAADGPNELPSARR
ncbi:MAG: cation-transporting P-type ATPase, partial [Candidatus Baltobacteraceae bacterium]